VLIAFRTVQGVGAAMLFPTSLGLLLPEWPVEKHAVPVAIWSAVGGVAAAAGPPLGGLLVEAGWRWVFIVNLPIGVAAFAIGYKLLTDQRDEHATERPDIVSAVIFTVAIAALILAIVEGQPWGWDSLRVIGLFAASAVALGVFAFRSARHPAPLIDPVIVRTRAIAFANLGGIFFFMAFATLLLGGVLFQTAVWKVSVLTAGLQLAPGPLTAAIFAVPGGALGDRFGQRYIGALGGVLFAVGGLWLRGHLGLHPHFATDLLPALVIGGAGVGLVLPTQSAAATGPLPASLFATGTAVLGMARQVGSALGVALFVAILGSPTPSTVLDDFRDCWMFLVVCAFCAAIALLLVGPVKMGSAEDLAAAETGPRADALTDA
jgi:MFS family permease